MAIFKNSETMKTKLTKLVTTLGLGALLAMPAFAQELPITGSVKSRLGVLELTNGYPTEATAQKLYDDIDFQRACQAYLWALPAVGFRGLHLAQLNTFGANDGDIVLYKDLQDKAGMLTPNITTIYAMSFWNLDKQGPLVVEVPPGATAGGIIDIWQRPVTDTGQTGPDKGKGGKYLILGPNSPDIEAHGYIVKRSPSVKVWFATRGLSPDAKSAEETLRGHKLYAWDKRDNLGETKFVLINGKEWTSKQPGGLDYWRYLSDVLQSEPIEARDRFFLAMLAPLGIAPGQPFAPDDRQQKILTEASTVGEIMARTIAYEKRLPGAEVWPGEHWEYANLVELNQEATNYAQLDERASWFYEAIANSTGMQGRILGFGQAYLETSKDKDGDWLSGDVNYRLRVPPNAPAKQFWSLTLYDNTTRGPVLTDQGASDFSSRKPNLVTNDNGSVDVYIGPTKPDGNKNWIKTNPGKGWFPYFRLYGPTEAYFNKTWSLPDIEKVR
jgi:hypothetical protein